MVALPPHRGEDVASRELLFPVFFDGACHTLSEVHDAEGAEVQVIVRQGGAEVFRTHLKVVCIDDECSGNGERCAGILREVALRLAHDIAAGIVGQVFGQDGTVHEEHVRSARVFADLRDEVFQIGAVCVRILHAGAFVGVGFSLLPDHGADGGGVALLAEFRHAFVDGFHEFGVFGSALLARPVARVPLLVEVGAGEGVFDEGYFPVRKEFVQFRAEREFHPEAVEGFGGRAERFPLFGTLSFVGAFRVVDLHIGIGFELRGDVAHIGLPGGIGLPSDQDDVDIIGEGGKDARAGKEKVKEFFHGGRDPFGWVRLIHTVGKREKFRGKIFFPHARIDVPGCFCSTIRTGEC